MAGLGFGVTGGAGGGGNKSMGIQFVKSSDNEKRQSFSNNPSPVDSGRPSRSSEGQNWRDVNSAPYQFGTPAKEFNSYRDKGSPMPGFVRPGEGNGKFFNNGDCKPAWQDYRSPGTAGNSKGSLPQQQSFPRTPAAKLVVTPQEYQRLWRQEKDPALEKIRKLAWEVASLKSDRPNAIDKLHSASNRVPTRVEFNTEPVFAARGNNSFMCHVFVEGVSIGSGQGLKIKDAKVNAYETALQRILMPELRVVRLDFESRELEGSKEPFTSPPPEPSSSILPKSAAQLPPSFKGGGKPGERDTKNRVSQHKESNLEAASVKRRIEEQRPLEEFVIVEPLVPIPDCTPAHTLRRSADFNHMLLEYEYFFFGESVRCVMWVEGRMQADVTGGSKLGAKNRAAEQGLRKLKEICWVIKTKQAVDSDTKISKEEMLNELTDQSDKLSDDNVGNKMLRKMGWSGGGVGKDGSGIAEPVSLKSVLNREGLGLGTDKGITDEYRRRVKEVIENYAASGNQEDLVFNCDFRLEERLIIHDECRRLNLRSKCKGKGAARYLCVRRKRSANMLFDHIMSCGGETIRYKLVPPGGDTEESYLPRKSANSISRQQINGQDNKSNSSFLRGASSNNHCYDSSPPGKIKRELNPCNDGRFKQELKREFGPPPPSLMDTHVDRDLKDEVWGQSSSSNADQYGSRIAQNGFQNSPSKFHGAFVGNSYNDSSPLKGIKKEFIPHCDHRDDREVKHGFEPPPFSSMNGNCKEEKWEQSFSSDGIQDIRNDGSMNESEDRKGYGPNSSYFSGNYRDQERHHGGNFSNRSHNNNYNGGPGFDTRNVPGPAQNFIGNLMNLSANGHNLSHNFNPSSDQGMRMQQNRMGSSTAHNPNTTPMAANFQNVGLQNAGMSQWGMQNQFMKQGNCSGSFNQHMMPKNNAQEFAVQGPRNNMSGSMGARGQWMGDGAPNPQQNQQFWQGTAQNWGQMAAQWMAAQQGTNMGMEGGPRFSPKGQGFGGQGSGRGSMM